MRTALFTLALVAALAAGGQAEDKRAKTADGKEVILRADGTWAYAELPKQDKPVAGEFKKDKKSELTYTGKRKRFTLSLVPDAWEQLEKSGSPAAEVGFKHAEGDIYAIVVAERVEVPLDALKKAVVGNMRAVDKEAKILLDEKRTVNGKPMLCLTVEASVKEVPLTYHVYLYSGDEGSIQLLTWTGRKLFKESKADMEAFLNGFEVVKKGE